MQADTIQESDVVAMLEKKLEQLRMNYAEELDAVLKEIEEDIRTERAAEDTEKIDDLHKQLGI